MGAIETYLEVPVHDTLLMTRLGCCGRRVAVISRARAVTNRIPSETNAQNTISKATHVHRCRVCIAVVCVSLSSVYRCRVCIAVVCVSLSCVYRCRVCTAFDPCSLSPLGAHLAQAHGSTVVSHVRSVDLRAFLFVRAKSSRGCACAQTWNKCGMVKPNCDCLTSVSSRPSAQ